MSDLSEHSYIQGFFDTPARYSEGVAIVCQLLWKKGQGRTIEETTSVFNAVVSYYKDAAKPENNSYQKEAIMKAMSKSRETLSGALMVSGLKKEQKESNELIDNIRYNTDQAFEYADQII